MEQCKTDPCMFRKIVGAESELILVVYVDGIIVGGDNKACDGLLAKPNDEFTMSDLGELKGHRVVTFGRNRGREL